MQYFADYSLLLLLSLFFALPFVAGLVRKYRTTAEEVDEWDEA